MYQYQAAQLLSTEQDIVSADTVSNWECNRAMPDPEQVAAMERLYDAPGLWESFMRLQWPSFRERIPENMSVSCAGMAVINAGYQMADVAALTDDLARDLMDGAIQKPDLARKYLEQSGQALAALKTANAALQKLQK